MILGEEQYTIKMIGFLVSLLEPGKLLLYINLFMFVCMYVCIFHQKNSCMCVHGLKLSVTLRILILRRWQMQLIRPQLPL